MSVRGNAVASQGLRRRPSGAHFARRRGATLGRAYSESLESRLQLTINASVVVGGTLDINPISSVFSDPNAYTMLTVNYSTVPGTTHGTIAKYDGISETAWGTGAPNAFGPTATYGSTANRIFAGQGLRYHNNGTGQGTTESIPVTIRDSTGFSAYNDTIVISITSPVGAPQITTQPTPLLSAAVGTHVTLSVAATGNATLAYQWYTGFSPNTTSPIAGATSATYTTPNFSDIGQHFYWVQVKNSVGVANSNTVTVKSGHPPVVDPIGPFTVSEAGSVLLSGAHATDPDNGLFLVYDWDLDGDGIFGEAATANGAENVAAPTLTAGGHDGPGSFTVTLRATNDNGVSGTKAVTINVTNSAPTATFAGNSAGNTVAFTGQVDSTLDLASLKYSYDWNDDGTFETVDTASASASVPAAFLANFLAGQPVRGRVKDRDGAFTDYVASVHGRAIQVTTLADESNSTASYALTAGTSLREALALAETDATPDAIVFDPALFAAGTGNVNLTLTGSNTNGVSAFGIANPTFITGPIGTNVGLAIRGQGTAVNYRAFAVASTGALTLENLTLRDFGTRTTAAQGGAIYNAGGSVSLVRTTVTSNAATNTSSTTASGGAIYSVGGIVSLLNTTIVSNLTTTSGGTPGLGGGIYVRDGKLAILSSTISANAATDGRAVYLLSDSSASTDAVINNSILGQTDASVHDFAATFVAGGTLPTSSGKNNLIRSALNFGGTASNADPLLGAPGSNGGLMLTMPILPNSPAINAATATASVTLDERGIARPQGSLPDIGAFERLANPIVASSAVWEYDARQAMTISFNADVSVVFGRGNYAIQNLTTNTPVASTLGTLTFAADGKAATLNLTNLLADGRYRVTFNGVSGATTLDFFVLAGDANRDATIGFTDLLALARNYGGSGKGFSGGDFNYDGNVDFTDLLTLARGYGKTLAVAPAAPLAASADATTTTSRKRPVDVVG